MKTFPYVILISILFAACTAPLQLQDLSAQKNVFLPFRIDAIHIVDLRTDTITTNMELPVFATRQREWIIKPALKPDLQAEIIEMIKKSSNSDGLPVKVTLSITDGYYKISGNARQVGEHTLFDCTLRFDLLESVEYWVSSSHAFYDYVGVYNATEKHVREMYRITVRNSVYKALKQGESALENGSN